MNNNIKSLQLLLKDIERYIVTLIVISCYFYLGGVINTFLRPSNDGIPLFLLTVFALICTTYFLYKQKQIINKLNNMRIDE